MKRERDKVAPWSPPTRRSFVAMLGAAAGLAVIALRARAKTDDAPKPIWIGHC